ncbi:MAG: hypothetical protein ACXWDO_06880 [Bacteroidia bacterium]
MKVLLDIKDEKADFMLELLRHLKFVKLNVITDDEYNQLKRNSIKKKPEKD